MCSRTLTPTTILNKKPAWIGKEQLRLMLILGIGVIFLIQLIAANSEALPLPSEPVFRLLPREHTQHRSHELWIDLYNDARLPPAPETNRHISLVGIKDGILLDYDRHSDALEHSLASFQITKSEDSFFAQTHLRNNQICRMALVASDVELVLESVADTGILEVTADAAEEKANSVSQDLITLAARGRIHAAKTHASLAI